MTALMQVFLQNFQGKLLAVVLLAVPLVAAGGFVYKRTSRSTSWPEALFKSYAVLVNVPGHAYAAPPPSAQICPFMWHYLPCPQPIL